MNWTRLHVIEPLDISETWTGRTGIGPGELSLDPGSPGPGDPGLDRVNRDLMDFLYK